MFAETFWKFIIQAYPTQAAIVTAGHGSGVTAVADTPDSKDSPAIGHQQGGGMPLVYFFGALRNNHMAAGIFGYINNG
jgi:hypothetical protein